MSHPLLKYNYLFRQKHPTSPEAQHEEWKEILDKGHDPNEEWDDKHSGVRTSPLLSATLDHEIPLVKLLLEHGADLERRNCEGRTVLHEAIIRSFGDLIRLLLDHGANPNAKVTSGYLEGGTAIHLAVAEGQMDVMESLLSRDVDLTARTKVGWTALDIAVMDRQRTVLLALLQHIDLPGLRSDLDSELGQIHVLSAEDHDRAIIARHLIEHGVRGTDSEHRKLYLQCLTDTIATQGIPTDGTLRSASVLIDETEAKLMETGGQPGLMKWSRNLCSQCEQFQSQDGFKMFEIFEHSWNLGSVSRSAQHGCLLCHFLVECLNHHWCLLHQISKEYGEEFAVTPAVRIKIEHSKLTILGDHRMVVVCGEKIAFVDLNHVQKYINDAVSETSPSDTSGTHSERSLRTARAWLQQCQEEHVSCNIGAIGRLPTRVVDVGDGSRSPYVYLSNGEKEPYVALSYRWGTQQNFCSLTSNIEAYSKALPVESMPRTLADAIIITRKLLVRYLWIDALCILQDSLEDKASEVDRMGETFANALLTIAAKVSESSFEGCFRNRSWPAPSLFPLDLRFPTGVLEKDSRLYGRKRNTRTSKMNRMMLLFRHNEWPKKEEQPILETRGWTVQEECLSRRMLNFGQDQISWTCVEATRSERVPEEDDTRGTRKWQNVLRHVLVTGLSDYGSLNQVTPETLFEYWLDAVEDYSRRELSDPADKIAAIAGIQAAIGKHLEDTPVVGMWRERLFIPSLLWQVSTPGAAAATSRYPSWSWASLPLSVKCMKLSSGKVYEWSSYNEIVYFPEVLSWHLDATSQFDRVGGYVSLRCKILPLDKLTQKVRDTYEFGLYFDTAAAESCVDVWLMLVGTSQFVPAERHRRYDRHYNIDNMFLLVQKIAADRMDFRRIGMARAKSSAVRWHGVFKSAEIRFY